MSNQPERKPFYDLETAALVLAEIFVNYDLAEYIIEKDVKTDNPEFAHYHISQVAAHDILSLVRKPRPSWLIAAHHHLTGRFEPDWIVKAVSS